MKATRDKGKGGEKSQEKRLLFGLSLRDNRSHLFKTEIKCQVVGTGSYSLNFLVEDEHTFDLTLQKTQRDGYIEEQQLLTLHGEISYNISNTSAYLVTTKGPDLK